MSTFPIQRGLSLKKPIQRSDIKYPSGKQLIALTTMAEKRLLSPAERSGVKPEEIDFDSHPDEGCPFLAIPDITDGLEETKTKCQALDDILSQGKSLAVYTGLSCALPQERDPEKTACAAMSPMELRLYLEWKNGTWKPELGTHAPVHSSFARTSKRSEIRSRAVRFIWGESVTDEDIHRAKFSGQPLIASLIKAVMRVESARRNLVNGFDQLSPMEYAELQTLHKIKSVAAQNLAVHRNEHKNKRVPVLEITGRIGVRARIIDTKKGNLQPERV